jgi:hypothetical protein
VIACTRIAVTAANPAMRPTASIIPNLGASTTLDAEDEGTNCPQFF